MATSRLLSSCGQPLTTVLEEQAERSQQEAEARRPPEKLSKGHRVSGQTKGDLTVAALSVAPAT